MLLSCDCDGVVLCCCLSWVGGGIFLVVLELV